jgi:hypothetical protein
MATILIGLDDTDNETSPGTGWMARQLAKECVARGLEPVGITRHQFPQDPRIAYTSHNSGACLVAQSPDGVAGGAFAYDLVAGLSAPGSDPGVCVVAEDTVSPLVVEFAKRTTKKVVEMSEAMDIAQSAKIDLRPLGGLGIGVIGALASVGLRFDGNEGRFIDLPGLRDLPERVRAAEVEELGIRLEHAGQQEPNPDDFYETFNWVRPNLADKTPVWRIEWSDEHNAWIPVDRKRSRPLE